MCKNIAILGSTGSIGTQTLEVVDMFPDEFRVVALSAGGNAALLAEQVKRYRPALVAVMDETRVDDLRGMLAGFDVEIVAGLPGLNAVATFPSSEILVTAVSGRIGLEPTLAAIRAGKDIALANKETLVAAGSLVMREARQQGIRIIPVDSEHSAVFQCLEQDERPVSRLILTASGGPFRGKSKGDLAGVTREMALRHPNWSMGAKITIDSATLMNKGLEVIEAFWLFNVEWEQISVVVHPQSIIHSMVEYQDGSILAHLGQPDMRIPIQYALTYPNRRGNKLEKLNLVGRTLSFEEPDRESFPALNLAFAAGKRGGTLPAVMNAANEIAVNLFLEGKISFMAIMNLVEAVMAIHTVEETPDLTQILAADAWARETTLSLAKG
ncbi:MAG TPA: 1-deoxy-D-xylulose-5-phosphate reductoisomerase [Verrucomicrobiae bacterium]|nr:1-deoxy-D-xylulose-5-phosphate reductoisomerase [Verrucomicrobiae bacterium]